MCLFACESTSSGDLFDLKEQKKIQKKNEETLKVEFFFSNLTSNKIKYNFFDW
jgi:hypothetical protein